MFRSNICYEQLFYIYIRIIPNIFSHVNTLRENNRTFFRNICLP
nr:MAG TPA: FcoT-like thioesterase domain protein [Inoviridae sp.]